MRSGRLKQVVTFVGRGSSPDYADGEGIPIINQACIRTDGIDLAKAKFHRRVARPETLKGWLRRGDVLVNSTGTGTLGRVAHYQLDGGHLADGHVTVVRPGKGVNDRYLYWHLSSSAAYDFIYTSCVVGATNQIELARERLLEMPLWLPSLSEQRALVDYLDAETARIDELIAKKRRMIDLLGAHMKAAINDAVWVNIDGTVPLMHLTEAGRPIMYGIVLPGPDVPQGIPIVKGGDVASKRLHPDQLNRTTPEIEAPYARARLQPGDLVFAIRGGIGDVEVVPAELAGANITQDVARVAPAPDVDSRWLRMVLRSPRVKAQVGAVVTGATVKGLNIGDLKRITVPASGVARQSDDLRRLLQIERRCDALLDGLARQIDLLVEHRQALITAAVTGELAIPGVAA